MASLAGQQTFFQPKNEADKDSIQRVAEEQKDQSCSGWENDPQSFCVKVAKHFMQTEFGGAGEVVSIDIEDDGGCRVHFDDGVKLTIHGRAKSVCSGVTLQYEENSLACAML